MPETDQLIRRKELKKFLGNVSDSSLDRWERNNGFPKKIRLGSHSIAWDFKEVREWVQKRKKQNIEIGAI